jgi:capsular exopolysaccharide synthesis family protein
MAPPIIKRFLISCNQNKALGLLIFGLIFGGSGVIALIQGQSQAEPPRIDYKATGQISFNNPPPTFTSTGQQIQDIGKSIDLNSLFQSRRLQEQIKAKLNIDDARLGELITKQLKITLPESQGAQAAQQAQLVTLDYTETAKTTNETDRLRASTKAVSIVKAFVDEIIEESRLLNTSQLTERTKALEERLTEVKRDLAAAEESFYSFISTKGSELLAVQDGSLFSGITGAEQQQRQIQIALGEVDGELNSLIQRLGLNPSQAYSSSALSSDTQIASLRSSIFDLESQIKLLTKDLKPEHPRVKTLQKQLDFQEEALVERAREVLGGTPGFTNPLPSQVRQDSSLDTARQELANRLVALESQREGLLRQLQSVRNTETELRQQYERFPDKQIQQTRLAQELEAQRALYQTILTNLTDAKSAETETVSSFRISQAPVAQELIIPQGGKIPPLLIIGAGFGLGLLSSLGAMFLLATLDDRLYTGQEVKGALDTRDVPLLGQIPYVISFDLDGNETPILLDTDSGYLNFYEKLRSNIRRLATESAKVILVTSIDDEEGKTITSYNLAIASAMAGKRTLLIEGDLRSGSLCQVLKIEPDPDAKERPLNYYADRGEAIRLVPSVENLYILPSPGPTRQAPAVLESSEISRLLEDARGRFDFVIVDSPALSKCNDALLLQPLTDGIVLVARPGLIKGSMLNEAIDEFVEDELPLLGVVINDVERFVSAINLNDDRKEPAIEVDSELLENQR